MAEVFTPLFLLWNICTFAVMGIDKAKARQNKWRISESTLMLLALAMGALGVFAGMHVFRHKTKHAKFVLGVPVLLAGNILIIIEGYRLILGEMR